MKNLQTEHAFELITRKNNNGILHAQNPVVVIKYSLWCYFSSSSGSGSRV
jgi:hypothetical protein